MKKLAWSLVTIGLGAALNGYAQGQTNAPAGPTELKDPIQLCQKLAGTEREICLKQARENPAAQAPATGGTPGAGSAGRVPDAPAAKPGDDKRGNTPPGTTRGGDAPASGAIVDPAGVTKR